MLTVINLQTREILSPDEILNEVNRDHSEEFIFYTHDDLIECPEDLADWLDPQYFSFKF